MICIMLLLMVLAATPADAGEMAFGSTLGISGQQNTIEYKEGMAEESLNSWYGMQTAMYSVDARLGYLNILDSGFGFAFSVNSFGSYIENNSSAVSLGGGFHLYYDSKDLDPEESVLSIYAGTLLYTEPYSMEIDTRRKIVNGHYLFCVGKEHDLSIKIAEYSVDGGAGLGEFSTPDRESDTLIHQVYQNSYIEIMLGWREIFPILFMIRSEDRVLAKKIDPIKDTYDLNKYNEGCDNFRYWQNMNYFGIRYYFGEDNNFFSFGWIEDNYQYAQSNYIGIVDNDVDLQLSRVNYDGIYLGFRTSFYDRVNVTAQIAGLKKTNHDGRDLYPEYEADVQLEVMVKLI